MSPAVVRSKRLRSSLRLMGGAAAVGGLLVVLATARAAQIEPRLSRPAPVAIDDHGAEADAAEWTISAEPIERIGYRRGHRQTLSVVPLGPTAVEVEVRTAQAFLTMRAAAAEAGVDLRLESGFRTVAQQRALYRAWRKGRGNKAALPGRSNHQSGRALDITVSAPGALAWLETHASTFGFTRTVKNEPWHWEYVEVPVARGATKRVVRKPVKPGKSVGHAKRPSRRPSSVATAHRAAGNRVATAR